MRIQELKTQKTKQNLRETLRILPLLNLPIFCPFYIQYMIDSNHQPMLPLAEKLEVEQRWNLGV